MNGNCYGFNEGVDGFIQNTTRREEVVLKTEKREA